MNNLFLTIGTAIATLIIGLGYGKSKTWASKLRFTLIPIAIAISTAFIFYIIGCWKFIGLGKPPTSIYQLQITPLFPIAYCLISLIVICTTAWKKDGFKNLKNPKTKKGLIGRLIFWLIIGLIIGLIFGLIGRLISGLIGGLIIGLIIGLISGLIIGLIIGLSEEFEEDKKPDERINDPDEAYNEAIKEKSTREEQEKLSTA